MKWSTLLLEKVWIKLISLFMSVLREKNGMCVLKCLCKPQVSLTLMVNPEIYASVLKC